jgi:DNA uptake protein ComE-like DNA-binding protein
VNRQSATYSTANGSAVNDPPWIVRTRRVGIPIFGTWGRRRPGVLWALVPLVTLGIGSAPAFVYLSVRYHRFRYMLPALAYAVSTGVAVTLIARAHALTIGIGVALLLTCMGTATAHALAVRRDVAVDIDDEMHVNAARQRLKRRARARKLAIDDPDLAHELGIGRPDLSGEFDDGGLVDVNHSPVEVLVTLQGIDQGIADRIASYRHELGGFTSLDELSVTLDLHPAQFDAIADRLLFLRA